MSKYINAAYPLRMSADLKDQLKEIAQSNNRPLSDEIIERLRKSLESELSQMPTEKLLEELVKRFDSVEIKINRLSEE